MQLRQRLRRANNKNSSLSLIYNGKSRLNFQTVFSVSVFKETFKKIALESCLIVVASAGKLAADNDRILTDYLDILPAYSDIIVSAHKPETSAFAPDYHRYETSAAGIDFNIADIAEPTTGFSANDLFVPQVSNTAIHIITTLFFDYILLRWKDCN